MITRDEALLNVNALLRLARAVLRTEPYIHMSGEAMEPEHNIFKCVQCGLLHSQDEREQGHSLPLHKSDCAYVLAQEIVTGYAAFFDR